jgi:hypothetical protein
MSKKISKYKISKILKMYNKGVGTHRISSILSIHRTTVQKYLKINKTILRRTSPWKNTYNIKFFSRYNKINCYWAGFLLADGYIRNNRDSVSLKLQPRDHSHIIKFKKTINFAGKIKRYKKYSNIDISGAWFIKDLKNNFNIIPNKTFRLNFPKIPSQFISHFIRGIMDGDGSISFVTNKYGMKYITVSFLGYKPIIEKIRDILRKKVKIKLKSKNVFPPLVKHDNPKIASIYFSGKNAINVLNYIYKRSTNKIRLTRKYNRYHEERKFYMGCNSNLQ